MNEEKISQAFEEIKALIAEEEIADTKDITMETSFKELGISSLDSMDLMMQLEEKLGIFLELDSPLKTIGELAEVVSEKR